MPSDQSERLNESSRAARRAAAGVDGDGPATAGAPGGAAGDAGVMRHPFGDGAAELREPRPMFAGFGPGVDVKGLPTGHWPMFSRPAELEAVLAEIGAR